MARRSPSLFVRRRCLLLGRDLPAGRIGGCLRWMPAFRRLSGARRPSFRRGRTLGLADGNVGRRSLAVGEVHLEPDVVAELSAIDAPPGGERLDEIESPATFFGSSIQLIRVEARTSVPHRYAKAALVERHRDVDGVLRCMAGVPHRVRDQLAREEHRVIQHLPRRGAGRGVPDEPSRFDERRRARGEGSGAGGHSPSFGGEVCGGSNDPCSRHTLNDRAVNIVGARSRASARAPRRTVASA
jgi:hypothetical protein